MRIFGIDWFAIIEGTMPVPYSMDLRQRVIAMVEAGACRREAAKQFGLSPRVVIIWVQRYEATGSVAPRPTGGSVSPLEEHEEFILGLIPLPLTNTDPPVLTFADPLSAQA